MQRGAATCAHTRVDWGQACIICGILASWMPGTLFLPGTFWQFMCFLGTFLEKSRDLRVYFGKMLRFTSFLGTFLGKMRFFRHILYAHFQAIFLGSQAPKTFMQAWEKLKEHTFSSSIFGMDFANEMKWRWRQVKQKMMDARSRMFGPFHKILFFPEYLSFQLGLLFCTLPKSKMATSRKEISLGVVSWETLSKKYFRCRSFPKP